MDDGVGTGPSTFSPMVKAKPPGFLEGSCSFFLEASSASFSFRLVTSLWSGKMLSILFILFFCSSLSPARSFAPIKRRSTFLTGVPSTSAGLGTLIPVTLLCSTTGVLALSLLPSPPPSCWSILLSEHSLPEVVSTATSVLFLFSSFFLLFFFAASASLLRFLFNFSSLSLSGDLNTLERFAGGGESPPPSASSSSDVDPSSLSSS